MPISAHVQRVMPRGHTSHHVRTRGRFMDRSQLDTLARRYLSTRFDQAEEWLAVNTDEIARDVWGD